MPVMTKQNLKMESQQQKENVGAGPSGIVQPEKNNEKEYRNYSVNHVHIPQVILGNIFEKLDPTDKVTFSRAHEECHDLVARKRSMFLAEGIAPTLVKTLPKEALPTSRQLCKSLTLALNHQIPDNRATSLCNIFNTSENIQRFLEEMEEHPANPFPGRNIEFSELINPNIDLPHVRMEYWDHAIQLLRQLGWHIHSFTYEYAYGYDRRFYQQVNTITMARNLRECLLLLPNLKKLTIRSGRRGYGFGRLQPYFDRHPLPRLQYLEEFCAFGAHPTIIETVLSSCPVPATMKSLVVDENLGDVYTRFPECLFNFINLEELEARIHISEFQRLGTQLNVPPLKVVKLSFPGRETLNPQLVFKALEPFHKTLTRFDCSGYLNATKNYEGWATSTYNLPNLRELRLAELRGSFDPFVHFKSLTDFHVRSLFDWDQPEPIPVPNANVQNTRPRTASPVAPIVEHVQMWGFKGKMYESNIWRLIPSLNNVCVDFTDKYTRYNYNKIRKAELEAATAASKVTGHCPPKLEPL